MNERQLSALRKAAREALDECNKDETAWFGELDLIGLDFTETEAHFIALASPEYILWFIDSTLPSDSG